MGYLCKQPSRAQYAVGIRYMVTIITISSAKTSDHAGLQMLSGPAAIQLGATASHEPYYL